MKSLILLLILVPSFAAQRAMPRGTCRDGQVRTLAKKVPPTFYACMDERWVKIRWQSLEPGETVTFDRQWRGLISGAKGEREGK